MSHPDYSDLDQIFDTDSFEQFQHSLSLYKQHISKQYFLEVCRLLAGQNRLKFLAELILTLGPKFIDRAGLIIFSAKLLISSLVPKEDILSFLKFILDRGENQGLLKRESDFLMRNNLEELVMYDHRDMTMNFALRQRTQRNKLPLKHLILHMSQYVIQLRDSSIFDPTKSVFDQPTPNYLYSLHNRFDTTTFDRQDLSWRGKRMYQSADFLNHHQIDPRYLRLIIDETLSLGRPFNDNELEAVAKFIFDDYYAVAYKDQKDSDEDNMDNDS